MTSMVFKVWRKAEVEVELISETFLACLEWVDKVDKVKKKLKREKALEKSSKSLWTMFSMEKW